MRPTHVKLMPWPLALHSPDAAFERTSPLAEATRFKRTRSVLSAGDSHAKHASAQAKRCFLLAVTARSSALIGVSYDLSLAAPNHRSRKSAPPRDTSWHKQSTTSQLAGFKVPSPFCNLQHAGNSGQPRYHDSCRAVSGYCSRRRIRIQKRADISGSSKVWRPLVRSSLGAFLRGASDHEIHLIGLSAGLGYGSSEPKAVAK